MLFHVVNERHLRGRSMLFTTNKSPLTAWGAVLHDADLAEAIVDRILERGRLMLLDGPSYRTQHLDLDVDGAELAHDGPARISGNTGQSFRNPQILSLPALLPNSGVARRGRRGRFNSQEILPGQRGSPPHRSYLSLVIEDS